MAIPLSLMLKENMKKIIPQNDVPSEALFNWFPGHMVKAMREIKQKLKMVDIIFEIRDARLPLSSGNRALDELLGQKTRIIVLNKANLANNDANTHWQTYFENKNQMCFFVDCFDKNALKKVIPLARTVIEEKRKQSNPELNSSKSKIKIMILGLPNTGKSTIINQLANKNATKVANKPGLTQIQQWIQIDEEIDLLDTPGVMPPKVESDEQALWLSAIHAIPDHISGEESTAAFLVKHLLEIKSPEFFNRFQLPNLDLSIEEVFERIGKLRGCLKQKGQPDLDRVCKIILNEFRDGLLGKTTFEIPISK